MTDLREKVLDSGLLLVYGKLYLGLVRLIPSTRGLERIEGDSIPPNPLQFPPNRTSPWEMKP